MRPRSLAGVRLRTGQKLRAGSNRRTIRGYLWGSQKLRHASKELRDF